MPTEQEMKASLQKYLEGFNEGNSEKVISLFAEDARVEDPVGSEPLKGKASITTFFQQAIPSVKRLELAAPIRGSHGNAAAMAFNIYVEMEGKGAVIRCIDVMTFNDDGFIIDMKAYWGPEDVQS
ncbi:steroid delta-isomerase [Oceanobacillus iheyensis HTE831]|uniref:Steroid delta-isomerase n=1 Tax=Oceanobacillus iheyensis (strain DSM 14371 / CIP 107618 / JCM 11309 / KCTC 3954 / HTE831) TaxID=221109 RepID=Q8ETH3_OCEIH|nr:steroid Delta-isomerase [Oceanobacillus iheyensis]BAC12244.1 steroid delta-isomerase [Oceanobacillus iheyensis HTE831]